MRSRLAASILSIALWHSSLVASEAFIDTPPPPPDEKVICKHVTVTGSRLGQRICRTKAQWQREADEAREIAKRMQGPVRQNEAD